MTINELISILETIRDEQGNINVVADFHDEYGEMDGYDEPTVELEDGNVYIHTM